MVGDSLASSIPIHIHARHAAHVVVLSLGKAGVALDVESGEVDAGGDDTLVVVRVHAHAVRFQIEGELAVLDLLELVLVKVGPSPDPGVDDMRKSFPCGDLEPSI